jgi:ubiquinone/menaquinone biosynthesis C-methylase UbiE
MLCDGLAGSPGISVVGMTPGELRFRERCLEKLGYSFRGDEHLVDVGCGDGGVARLLRERVREVTAIDIQPSEQWNDEDGLFFRVANGEDLPFDDKAFDLVHSKDSLHHMDNPEAALLEYRRVLRPGGTALIIEANRFNPVFYVHMTKMLGHEHFSRSHFRDLVRAVFPGARFGAFEAHFVPRADRLLRLQGAIENFLERLPAFPQAYNFAVAPR